MQNLDFSPITIQKNVKSECSCLPLATNINITIGSWLQLTFTYNFKMTMHILHKQLLLWMLHQVSEDHGLSDGDICFLNKWSLPSLQSLFDSDEDELYRVPLWYLSFGAHAFDRQSMKNCIYFIQVQRMLLHYPFLFWCWHIWTHDFT